MTDYFDEADDQLQEIRAKGDCWEAYEALRKIEARIVHDCSVCSMFEEFPKDIRTAMAKLILKKGIATQPANTPPDMLADFEHFSQHVERLRVLFSDLHSLFHEVAYRPDCIFGDSPRSGVMMLDAQAEEIRERLAAEAAGTTLEAQLEEQMKKVNE